MTTTAARPRPGTRVRTDHEGVYRTISARGPEFDTFTPKVGNTWLGTYATEDDAVIARGRVTGGRIATRLMTTNQFVVNHWMQLYGYRRIARSQKGLLGAVKPLLAKFGDRRPADIDRLEALEWTRRVRPFHVRAARTLFNDIKDAGLLMGQANPFE